MYRHLISRRVCLLTTTGQRIYGILTDWKDGFFHLVLEDGGDLYVNGRNVVWACEVTEDEEQSDDE